MSESEIGKQQNFLFLSRRWRKKKLFLSDRDIYALGLSQYIDWKKFLLRYPTSFSRVRKPIYMITSCMIMSLNENGQQLLSALFRAGTLLADLQSHNA